MYRSCILLNVHAPQIAQTLQIRSRQMKDWSGVEHSDMGTVFVHISTCYIQGPRTLWDWESTFRDR